MHGLLADARRCLVVAGVADVISVVLRSTIIQLATPDNYRGRINAAEIIVGGSVPQLGNFRAGAVAQASLTDDQCSRPADSRRSVGAVPGRVGASPQLVRYRVRDEVSAGRPAHR